MQLVRPSQQSCFGHDQRRKAVRPNRAPPMRQLRLGKIHEGKCGSHELGIGDQGSGFMSRGLVPPHPEYCEERLAIGDWGPRIPIPNG